VARDLLMPRCYSCVAFNRGVGLAYACEPLYFRRARIGLCRAASQALPHGSHPMTQDARLICLSFGNRSRSTLKRIALPICGTSTTSARLTLLPKQ
jgi:hypothetical protein